jgi:plastocyanin
MAISRRGGHALLVPVVSSVWLRLDRAKHLLSGTDLTVTRIAEASGYASRQYFCRAFHRATGSTPLAYREEVLPHLPKRSASAKAGHLGETIGAEDTGVYSSARKNGRQMSNESSCLTCYGSGEIVTELGPEACPDCAGAPGEVGDWQQTERRLRDIEQRRAGAPAVDADLRWLRLRSRSPAPPRTPRRPGFLGCGLDGRALAIILALATLAFLFWDGPLWSMRPGASFVARIVGSYLIVIPLTVGALIVARRSGWTHLLSSVGIVWIGKLVITATAYAYLAPGSATQYSPDRPWETRANVGAPQVRGEASDVVNDRATGAVVNETGIDVALDIEQSHYAQSTYHLTLGDRLTPANHDAVLHTLRITQEGRAVANIPLPAGNVARRVSISQEGTYELSCENHPSERATLVVIRPSK